MLLSAILVCIGAFNALALPEERNVAIKKGDKTYLLPDNAITPQKYYITIDVSKSFVNIEDKKFSGSVLIIADVNENIQNIILHSVDITIKEDIIVRESYTNNYYKSTRKFDTERQFLIIELEREIEKGTSIVIEIQSYDGKFQDDMHGFYISSYMENNDPELKYVLATQFQPTHARKAFPCFDEPKYKAEFELIIKKEKKYKVISNRESWEPDFGSGVTEVRFFVTPKMSTYLLAFIVTEFANSSTQDPEFKVWSRPDAIGQTNTAINYMPKIIKELYSFLGAYHGVYFFRLNMVVLPDFSAGAMGNWALLTFRETALLVDEELSTNKDIQRVVSVISHQIAHQWFGNLVTTEWWSNIWLNEGFATYFEYHTIGNVIGWEMKDQFVVEQQQSVFGIDSLVKSTPLTFPVYTPQEINSHFGSISCAKGSSVIRMMTHFLGLDNFRHGLELYLDKNRMSSTVPTDLWSAMQENIDTNNINFEYSIKQVMSTWISQAGYPVVNVRYNSEGYIEFSQQRFYMNPLETTNDQVWFVPISYTTSKESYFVTKPKLWLTPTEQRKIISTDDDIRYILVNIEESGYYRVNYDDILWGKLAEMLTTEERQFIPQMNRAQIVDDVLNLARAGLVDYEVAFNVTDNLATETNYFPWYSAIQAFKYMLQRYSDTENTGTELRLYLKNLTEVLIEDKEFKESRKETQVQIFKKALALEWACNIGHTKCVDQAKELFKNFKAGTTKIPKNMKSIVYCTALRNGDKTDWDFLWGKFETSNSAAEKIGIINALGCSNEKVILNDFLKKSINPASGIRKQDALYVFQSVYTGNSKGVDVAFDFLKKNLQKIIENYNGLNDLEKAVLGLADRLTNKAKITQFKVLLYGNNNFATFRDAAIEIVDNNVAWTEKYAEKIEDILYTKRNNGSAGFMANKYVVIFLGFMSIYFSMFK